MDKPPQLNTGIALADVEESWYREIGKLKGAKSGKQKQSLRQQRRIAV